MDLIEKGRKIRNNIEPKQLQNPRMLCCTTRATKMPRPVDPHTIRNPIDRDRDRQGQGHCVSVGRLLDTKNPWIAWFEAPGSTSVARDSSDPHERMTAVSVIEIERERTGLEWMTRTNEYVPTTQAWHQFRALDWSVTAAGRPVKWRRSGRIKIVHVGPSRNATLAHSQNQHSVNNRECGVSHATIYTPTYRRNPSSKTGTAKRN